MECGTVLLQYILHFQCSPLDLCLILNSTLKNSLVNIRCVSWIMLQPTVTNIRMRSKSFELNYYFHPPCGKHCPPLNEFHAQ